MTTYRRVCLAAGCILALLNAGPRGIGASPLPASNGLSPEINAAIANPAIPTRTVANLEIPSPRIAVLLYNYAAVPAATMERAARTAAQVFDGAGIKTIWREVSLAPGGSKRSLPENGGAAILYLRVLPKSMSGRIPSSRACFGFANSKASIANVFFDRARALAWDRMLDPGLVLGHLMAHEMGHLLLAGTKQSRKGIMSHQWKAEHLVRASMGQLAFTRREAAAMRTTLSRGTQAAGALDALLPDHRQHRERAPRSQQAE